MTKKRLNIAFILGFALLLAYGFIETRIQAYQGKSLGDMKKVDFEKEIQPIFQKSCYPCHSRAAQMSGFRLDSKKLAFAGGQIGQAIIPGKASESPLFLRVSGIGELTRMPLGNKILSDPAIEKIRLWIDQGAEWPEEAKFSETPSNLHWAWVAPKRSTPPKVKNPSWLKNPIDNFILSRLENEKLAPSPETDKTTLLRRLSLDLIGLPPTPAEVDAFLNDQTNAAYEKQVERLLASPHYGERWARLWLDAARYADSDGYEKDKPRQVWFYRDWVIKVLNRDIPYDQFIIEQIAGDLLPNATQEQIVATGFLRNSMINEEGGVDPEQFRMEAMFDRMETIGKSVLGITIQCAQCHNHKYDPLTQEDYYRMFAFLNNSNEGSIAVFTPNEEMKRAEIFRAIRELEADLQHRNPNWQQQMAAWEGQIKGHQPDWVIIRPAVDDISTGGEKLLSLKDGSFLAQGYAPTKHRLKLTLKTTAQNVSAIRLELLTDPNLPLGGPGRSIKGTSALTEFEVEAASIESPDKPVKIKIAKATADINPPEMPLEPTFDDRSKRRRVTGPVEFAIDGKDETAWGIDEGPGRRNVNRKAVFTFEKPVGFPSGTLLTIYLTQNHGGWNSDDNQTHNLGRFRLAMTQSTDAIADPLPQTIREILYLPREQRSPAQIQTLFSFWRTTVSSWQSVNSKINELWKQHPEGTSQLALQERNEPRETMILARGDFLKPTKAVSPGIPAFLHAVPKGAPLNRLGFAKWVVDKNSPTTARAMVNRVWQAYFSTGLVSTPENFGMQSEHPSHPALLDWLAVEFMEKGWRLKTLHRLIVTSATYRQTSKVTQELNNRDPYNLLLARGARFRVDAEIVRDIALSASGLLSPTIGGPSVFPPAPDFLFTPPVSYGPKIWKESTGTERYRRALYTFRYRSVPYPVLQTFDAPNGDVSCVRRSRSNTPLQALTTLNETLFMEAARALAWRTVIEGGITDELRLTFMFRSVLSRFPTADETTELLSLYNKQKQRFIAGELNPWNLAVNEPDKPSPLPKGVTMDEVAAWTAVSRVLFNLDETITRE